MQGCNHIRRLIDEADQPDIFSLEVTGHIAHCNACRGFAAERSALRGLIASGKRVGAPVNFDAMLNARLAEARGQTAPSWLSPAAFMRMGAAAAGLVMALVVIQLSGLFSTPESQTTAKQNTPEAVTPAPPANPGNQVLAETRPPASEEPKSVEPESEPSSSLIAGTARAPRGNRIREAAPRRPDGAPNFEGIEDGGVILVRGQNGEREVPLPTVSVGAQPLLYVNSKPSASRSAGTSF
jgi:hypothetical protein